MKNMVEQNIRRNIIVTILLWIYLLTCIIGTTVCIVSMARAWQPENVLGQGLCAMFSLANILGLILLFRWDKNGFWLLGTGVTFIVLVSMFLLAGDIPMIIFGGVVLVLLWSALQIKTGRISVWRRLKSGWDMQRCRHIYQLFTLVEIVLFIIMLTCYGQSLRHKPVSPDPDPIIISDTVGEIQDDAGKNQDNQSGDENNLGKNDKPDNKDRETEIYPEKSPKDERKQEKSPGKSAGPSSEVKPMKNKYSIEDAANYLDTHDVWNKKQMEQYPQLGKLYNMICNSLHDGKPPHFPGELLRKSNRLRELDHQFRAIERLSHESDEGHRMARVELHQLGRDCRDSYISVGTLRTRLKKIEWWIRTFSDRKKDKQNNEKKSDAAK